MCCLIRFSAWPPGAVGPFVKAARLALERGDDVARVEAARGRLQPGDHPALAVRPIGRAGGTALKNSPRVKVRYRFTDDHVVIDEIKALHPDGRIPALRGC